MTTPRGNYKRGRDTRDKIIDATREVIRERGVYNTSITAVAENCDMTRAGVLHHFPSLEHLLLAAMEDRFAENQPWFAEQVAGHGMLEAMVRLVERLAGDPE